MGKPPSAAPLIGTGGAVSDRRDGQKNAVLEAAGEALQRASAVPRLDPPLGGRGERLAVGIDDPVEGARSALVAAPALQRFRNVAIVMLNKQNRAALWQVPARR